MLGGNAKQLVPENTPGSLGLVMSNFPEPPQWHSTDKGAETEMDDQHLLTREFLNESVWRSLKKSGVLLIHGDNKPYLQAVCKSL